MTESNDPIPKGHLSAMEAFNLFRKVKRGHDFDSEGPLFGRPELPDWDERAGREQTEDEDDFIAAFLRGELEAVYRGADGNEYRVPADRLRDSPWPGGILFADRIPQSAAGPHGTNRTPYLRVEAVLDWIARWTHGRSDSDEISRRLKTFAHIAWWPTPEVPGRPNHRPPSKRNAAVAELHKLSEEQLAMKREALLEVVNKLLPPDKRISRDTLRRALKELVAG